MVKSILGENGRNAVDLCNLCCHYAYKITKMKAKIMLFGIIMIRKSKFIAMFKTKTTKKKLFSSGYCSPESFGYCIMVFQ